MTIVAEETMKRWTILLSLLALPTLSACSTEAVKRSAYESLHQKHCIDTTGSPNCDPEHKHYDRYRKDRESLKPPQP